MTADNADNLTSRSSGQSQLRHCGDPLQTVRDSELLPPGDDGVSGSGLSGVVIAGSDERSTSSLDRVKPRGGGNLSSSDLRRWCKHIRESSSEVIESERQSKNLDKLLAELDDIAEHGNNRDRLQAIKLRATIIDSITKRVNALTNVVKLESGGNPNGRPGTVAREVIWREYGGDEASSGPSRSVVDVTPAVESG